MQNMNKVCMVDDWDDSELMEVMKELPFYQIPEDSDTSLPPVRHRKQWEWAMGILAMKKAGKLNDSSVCLGVGAGSEMPVFYLANKTKYVYSTDLYITEGRKWREADTTMLTNPEKIAPIPFNRKRLGVQNMNGTDITFEDNIFDIVFCYSSIEHFGPKRNAAKCMQEIERVLKPGGIASITTELYAGMNDRTLFQTRAKYSIFPHNILNRYAIFSEMFTVDELEKFIINSHNMKLTSPIEFAMDMENIENAVKFPIQNMYTNTGKYREHIFLDMKGIKWGSINLVFTKG